MNKSRLSLQSILHQLEVLLLFQTTLGARVFEKLAYELKGWLQKACKIDAGAEGPKPKKQRKGKEAGSASAGGGK